ncbi:2-oxo acid dehydrogenase subunit E2 [bacterium]|nr:2-oxo acid dehydrogenase subunit E2 [bacterium]
MSDVIKILFPADQREGSESFVSSWLKKPGQFIEQYEPLVEISTDKVSLEIPAPAAGVIEAILKNEGDKVEPGDILGSLRVGATASSTTNAAPEKVAVKSSTPTSAAQVNADLSPAVRKLIKDHNLSADSISGTGRGGRITLEDVENYLKNNSDPRPQIPSHHIPLTAMRKTIAQNMVTSMLRTAPHVTAVMEADLSRVFAHREVHKTPFLNDEIKLTFTPYFVTAAIKALQTVPEVNSRLHQDTIELFDTCNIGLAVAIPEGLVVPVLHAAEQKNFKELAKSVADLTDRARLGRLETSDIRGGTFTITNHGTSGSLLATPIILQPQSAILGVGKIEKRAKVITKHGQDAIEIRPCVYLTLTIDHRVLDGFTANTFLANVVETLENWASDA